MKCLPRVPGRTLLRRTVNLEWMKEVAEEPPEDEKKNGGIRSDAESIVA